MPPTSGIFTTGAKSAIGTSAVQITTIAYACVFGVVVRSDPANTGILYVGPEGVTKGTADATDGMKLLAGDSVLIEIDDASKIYVIGSAAGQKVFWAAV